MLVSIVIPSRERAFYLRDSLATATAIPDPDIEIVVSDNASVDETRQVVEANADPRIRYVNPGSRVSMRQNFEFALEQCRGDYVIYFGDDDGIIPGQFATLRRILQEHQPDGVCWDFPVYGWPQPGYGGSKTGGLRFVRDKLFGAPERIDMARSLRLAEQAQLDRLYPLPAIYHGCMSRDYLRRISRADGTCFLARSPDTYINFRCLQYGGTFLLCHHPFSINGHSPASNGLSMQQQGSGDAGSVAARFLLETRTDPVDDVMPLPKSMTLGFLSTLETVRHNFPDPPISPEYEPWYARVLLESRGKDADSIRHIREMMQAHAARTGSQPELAAAEVHRLGWRHRLATAVYKNRQKLQSFRVSTERAGRNTILTAAQTCDVLLGQDFSGVLDGDLHPRQAWGNVKRRRQELGGAA